MYGYKIENGTIVVVEDEAAIIRSIFKNYLSGMSMRKAADATGVDFPHSTVKKIIRQKRYSSFSILRLSKRMYSQEPTVNCSAELQSIAGESA